MKLKLSNKIAIKNLLWWIIVDRVVSQELEDTKIHIFWVQLRLYMATDAVFNYII